MSNITQMNTTKTVNIFRPDGISQRSNADIALGKEVYENSTIADMRASILDNIDATITAIDEYDGWSVRKFSEATFVSPLAKRVRTGVQVKIGYGAKNETLNQTIKDTKSIEENSNQILDFTREVKNLLETDKIKIIEA